MLASVHWDMQFVAVVPNAIPLVISDESDDLAWFPSLSLPDVDASVQALREDAARLSSPEITLRSPCGCPSGERSR